MIIFCFLNISLQNFDYILISNGCESVYQFLSTPMFFCFSVFLISENFRRVQPKSKEPNFRRKRLQKTESASGRAEKCLIRYGTSVSFQAMFCRKTKSQGKCGSARLCSRGAASKSLSSAQLRTRGYCKRQNAEETSLITFCLTFTLTQQSDQILHNPTTL